MTSATRITTPFTATSTAAEVLAGVDLTGRRAVVTGGASGIGIETARALAGAGAEVTLAVRNLDAGKQTAEDVVATTGNTRVLVAALDLADPASVASFVDAWDGPLHILVNNAGVMASPETRTPQGWELQFATNHLGHFALATGLHGALAAAGGARVVSVSSSAHLRSPVVFDDIHFRERPYEPWTRVRAVEDGERPVRRGGHDALGRRRHRRQRTDARRDPDQPAALRHRRGPRADARGARRRQRHPLEDPAAGCRHVRAGRRPHRCSTGSVAGTSRTAPRRSRTGRVHTPALPPTRSTRRRRSGCGRCRWRRCATGSPAAGS